MVHSHFLRTVIGLYRAKAMLTWTLFHFYCTELIPELIGIGTMKGAISYNGWDGYRRLCMIYNRAYQAIPIIVVMILNLLRFTVLYVPYTCLT